MLIDILPFPDILQGLLVQILRVDCRLDGSFASYYRPNQQNIPCLDIS